MSNIIAGERINRMLSPTRIATLGLFIIVAISGNERSFAKGKEPATQRRESDWDPLTLADKNAVGFDAIASALRRYTKGQKVYSFNFTTIPDFKKVKISTPIIEEVRHWEYEAGILRKCRFYRIGDEEISPPHDKTMHRLIDVFGKPKSLMKNVIPIPGANNIYVNWKIGSLELRCELRERDHPDGKMRDATFDVVFPKQKAASTQASVEGKTGVVNADQRRMIEKWLGVPLEVAYGNKQPTNLLSRLDKKGYFELALDFTSGLQILGIPEGIKFNRRYKSYMGEYKIFEVTCRPEEEESKKLLAYEEIESRLKRIWGNPISRERYISPSSPQEDRITVEGVWELRNAKGILTWRRKKGGVLSGTSVRLEIRENGVADPFRPVIPVVIPPEKSIRDKK